MHAEGTRPRLWMTKGITQTFAGRRGELYAVVVASPLSFSKCCTVRQFQFEWGRPTSKDWVMSYRFLFVC